jgi:hypothetical protein
MITAILWVIITLGILNMVMVIFFKKTLSIYEEHRQKFNPTVVMFSVFLFVFIAYIIKETAHPKGKTEIKTIKTYQIESSMRPKLLMFTSKKDTTIKLNVFVKNDNKILPLVIDGDDYEIIKSPRDEIIMKECTPKQKYDFLLGGSTDTTECDKHKTYTLYISDKIEIN